MQDRPNRKKKAVNLSIDAQLVEDARALGINISEEAEQRLRERIAEAHMRKWQRDNARSIAAWNRYIEENGLPLGEYRPF